ncbi:unnamed protein product [Clonostachys chloroleuca]|uniref:Zn(2)-C6 fungal-type domain-containing protein n=1 Tax=Clonostachys chloroleuca TaxID=1926264 RepID=A0AA35QB72_9HYPO|nr:unnamed protein product [Clonostachys chloroleuca]
MPGVPKSQGCQSCKLRKIKCDERWPACLHCQTSRLICPGPAQLFKFVDHSFQVPAKKKHPRASTPREHGAGRAWHNLRLQRAHGSGISVGGCSTPECPSDQSSSPKAVSPTPDELSCMRLISHLDGGLQRITHLGLTFVLKLPTRIQGSACLRDSVQLFCSGLTDFQHPEPKRDLMLLPEYGKALRSLRLALTNDEALKAETLAAVTLMERASDLFDRQGKKFNIHSRAAIQMMRQRGPTNTDDELDVAVCNDLYGMEMSGWTVKGSGISTKTTGWKDALERASSTHRKIIKGDNLAMSDLETLAECCRNLNALISEFQNTSRQSFEAQPGTDAATRNEQVSDMEAAIAKTIRMLLEYALEEGAMIVINDPDSIVGKRYDFTDPMLCQLYLVVLFLQLVPLQILYETDRVLHGKPDNDLHARLRAVAVEAWMCIPYIRSSGWMAARFPEAPLYATYEIADSTEKEYILDMLQYLDNSSGRRLPPSRAAQSAYVLKKAKVLMGRDPESFYF